MIEKGNTVSEKLPKKLFEESLVAQYNTCNVDKLIPFSRHIPKRVKVYFRKDVEFLTHKRLKVIVRRNASVTFNVEESDEKEILTKAALILRRQIFKVYCF